MELVKIIDGQPKPYTEDAFRADNPHTIYGKVVPARHLNAQDVYRVRTLPKPSEIGKKAVPQALPTQVNGEWILDWDLVALDADEARALRNNLLSETDWVVTKSLESGVAVPEEWVTYRQALRDITDQPDFPDNVVWPTQP